MIRTFKILSALLAYPGEELQQAAGEMRNALRAERLLPAADNTALLDFIRHVERQDPYQLQAHYVALFDRTRSLSLHLFEHVHGDSRDRGQAMIDLLALYERHGMRVTTRELPDYLPLFLEFLSILPLGEAREMLAQPLHILAALRQRLEKNGNGYAAVFAALESIAGGQSASKKAREIFTDAASNDPAASNNPDWEWAEPAVTFGPENSRSAPGRVYVEPPRPQPPRAPNSAQN